MLEQTNDFYNLFIVISWFFTSVGCMGFTLYKIIKLLKQLPKDKYHRVVDEYQHIFKSNCLFHVIFSMNHGIVGLIFANQVLRNQYNITTLTNSLVYLVTSTSVLLFLSKKIIAFFETKFKP